MLQTVGDREAQNAALLYHEDQVFGEGWRHQIRKSLWHELAAWCELLA